MKKFLVFSLLATVLTFGLTACSNKQKLYLAIWDEYIEESLIEQFEQENNCKVVVDILESNELMYSSITRDAAPYDVAVPSDYMIDQLRQEDLLVPIDFEALSNYSKDKFNSTLMGLVEENTELKDYHVPYFWGSLGILYNTDLINAEKQAKIKEDGFKVLFEKDFAANMAMYASSRDSIASALLALGYSLNTKDLGQLNEAKELLKKVDYVAWATDDLKIGIADGKYSVTLGYTGDFFDIVYSALESGQERHFDFYAPEDHNNVFYDSMVIPATTQNEELALKFIDFMIDHENALLNAQYVGYCPCLNTVYDAMINDEDYKAVTTLPAYDPSDIRNGEVYAYLGSDLYLKYEEIYKEVKK